jgi:hypothetical protein
MGASELDSTRMTSHRKLMRLHVEALFTHDSHGRLVRVNEPDGAPAPRFFLGRTKEGVIRRFRQDVSHEMRAALEAASAAAAVRRDDLESMPDTSAYEEILTRVAPVVRTETGPAFCFPATLSPPTGAILVTEENAHFLRPLLAAWIPDVRLSQPLFAVVIDRQAVSVCGSVRQTADAYEAGVETSAEHRGHGYAAQVATAWAAAVRDLGRVPLYSTSWTNTASRSVARRLGLLHFGSDLHLT